MLSREQKLERQVEELVRAYMEGYEQAAAAAVSRGVAAALSGTPPAVKRQARTAPRGRRPARSPEELARLEELVYAAMCETPGVTATVLAARLGVETRHLEVPLKRLKRAERVRSVGGRGLARYFPIAQEPATTVKLVAVGKEA